MFLTKKDFKRIINETASGFKVDYPPAYKPPVKKEETPADTDIPDYDKVRVVYDKNVNNGEDWVKKGGNFPIERNGKIYYVSRSVAVSIYAFCQNKWGDWCLLANQRGPGCKTKQGKWNAPCGFLDYGETAAEAAVREAREETGVDIPLNLVKTMGTNSARETVSIRHACILPGFTDDYPLSDANCEPGEVSDIKWIPVLDAKGQPAKDVFKYPWDRNPKDIVAQAETMLSHLWEPNGYGQKTKSKKDRIIWHLRNELRGNPRGNILLDELLKYVKGPGIK